MLLLRHLVQKPPVGRPENRMDLAEALGQNMESASLDFKSEFDPKDKRAWGELIKDLVAFANSGGGFILVGLLDNGAPSGHDVSPLLAVDLADFANKVNAVTGTHLVQVRLHEAERAGQRVAAIEVLPSITPVVFTRVGEAELPDGKKKTIFNVGGLYFRHGAKSEPGTSEDLRGFLDRELERVRAAWLEGIKKVVEAPTGSQIAVIPPGATRSGIGPALAHDAIQLTSDPTAATFYAMPVDKTHPHRQKELMSAVNARFAGKAKVNSRDLLAVRKVHGIDGQPTYCYLQNHASRRYSERYVDWLAERFADDPHFFAKARQRFDNPQATGEGG